MFFRCLIHPLIVFSVIKDKKGSTNLVVDHLSRLINKEVTQEELDIQDEFPDEFLLVVGERPWFADIANYKAMGIIPNKRGAL